MTTPKTHTMRLHNRYFYYIKNGSKRIELRLYDEKRKQIQLNDIIQFSNEQQENIFAKVIGLLHYKNFNDLIDDLDINLLADKSISKNDLLKDLNTFYSLAQQKQFGVLGIRIELMN